MNKDEFSLEDLLKHYVFMKYFILKSKIPNTKKPYILYKRKPGIERACVEKKFRTHEEALIRLQYLKESVFLKFKEAFVIT